MSNTKDFKVRSGIQPTVYQEGVGTVVSGSVGYSLSGASYDSISFSVASQETSPTGLFFKSDGTKVYIVGLDFSTVFQYSLSTAWDISTASYDSVSFSVSVQDTIPTGLSFSSDGTKMYVVGNLGLDINQYNLSTAWDISTASYSQNFSVSSQETGPTGVTFKTDGTKMYICGLAGDEVNEYNLSTAWDISTASASQVFSVSAQDGNPRSLFFKPDGTKMFLSGSDNDSVYLYNLSAAWDISTASYATSLSVTSQDTLPNGIYIKPDGTKMYVMGYVTDSIYQYSTVLNTASLDLSSGSVFDYTPTSDVQVTLTNPAASGTSSGATLLLGAEDATGVGSTFSTTLYTGTGANQTITNGLDLAGDGGLTWIKRRNAADSHVLTDSERGYGQVLNSDTTGANQNLASLFNLSTTSSGFTVGSNNTQINNNAQTYVSWSFKKQTKFFDVVTWTGNGSSQTIAHSLGVTPGCIIVKNTSNAANWAVWHRSNLATQHLQLNTTSAALTSATVWNSTNPTDSVFSVGNYYNTNNSGDTYVAYLFAHDIASDGLIQCGSFTTDSGSQATIDLGFEPSWVMYKMTNSTGQWYIEDTMRGLSAPTQVGDTLIANLPNAEGVGNGAIHINASGFETKAAPNNLGASNTFVYMAIRSAFVPTITYDPDLQWSGGTAPTAPAIGETDVLTFNTTDGGTTYQAVVAIDGAK